MCVQVCLTFYSAQCAFWAWWRRRGNIFLLPVSIYQDLMLGQNSGLHPKDLGWQVTRKIWKIMLSDSRAPEKRPCLWIWGSLREGWIIISRKLNYRILNIKDNHTFFVLKEKFFISQSKSGFFDLDLLLFTIIYYYLLLLWAPNSQTHHSSWFIGWQLEAWHLFCPMRRLVW